DPAHLAWIPDPALMVKGQRYNDAAQAVSELDAGISFTVPWLNPTKYSAGVREARENVGAAEQAFDREEKEALRLLRDQLEKIETAHHHVELFRDKLVPQARQAFEATRFSYESGEASFLDWITAQRNLRDIEAMAREHLADYQVAVAELEAVIGAELYARPAQQPKAKRKPEASTQSQETKDEEMKGMSGMQGMPEMKEGADNKAPQTSEFVVPVERQQQIGVTYAAVERKPLRHTIRSVGMVVPDKGRNW